MLAAVDACLARVPAAMAAARQARV
jgi:hypothetical protein